MNCFAVFQHCVWHEDRTNTISPFFGVSLVLVCYSQWGTPATKAVGLWEDEYGLTMTLRLGRVGFARAVWKVPLRVTIVLVVFLVLGCSGDLLFDRKLPRRMKGVYFSSDFPQLEALQCSLLFYTRLTAHFEVSSLESFCCCSFFFPRTLKYSGNV